MEQVDVTTAWLEYLKTEDRDDVHRRGEHHVCAQVTIAYLGGKEPEILCHQRSATPPEQGGPAMYNNARDCLIGGHIVTPTLDPKRPGWRPDIFVQALDTAVLEALQEVGVDIIGREAFQSRLLCTGLTVVDQLTADGWRDYATCVNLVFVAPRRIDPSMLPREPNKVDDIFWLPTHAVREGLRRTARDLGGERWVIREPHQKLLEHQMLGTVELLHDLAHAGT